MPVTLRAVAEHAGVSVRTVSNVVNGFHHVSPHMRARVQAALDELNYRPNLLARGLRQGRTGIIALLVPEISVAYFGELAHEIVERAGQLGMTVLIDETGGLPSREVELVDIAAQSRWVDGLLLSSLGLDGPALAGLRSVVPLVLLGERTAESAHDHVGIDNVLAARTATEHLIGQGRRRIVAVGGADHPDDATSCLRLRGYRAALSDAGIPTSAEFFAPTVDYSRRSGSDAVRDLLARDHVPDALLCFNDELALGAMRELYAQGVRVPVDVAVVGFDDGQAAQYSIPALTSVAPDKAHIAGAALEMLLDRIGGSDAKPRAVRVGHELKKRESSSVG